MTAYSNTSPALTDQAGELRRDRVHLRRLASSETDLFLAHLQRLDADARRLRFGHHVGEAFLKTYAAKSLSGNSVVEGLFVNGVLRGVAELHFIRENRREAEAAYSVEKLYRGRGYGRRLFDQSIVVARNRGVRRLDITYLRENARIMALARSHGAAIRYEGSDVIAELPAQPADLQSIRSEWRQEAQAMVERGFENWQRWSMPFWSAAAINRSLGRTFPFAR